MHTLTGLIVTASLVLSSASYADDNPNCGTGGDCYVASTEPGCADAACCKIVCEVDSACCETAWDEVCVKEATELCGAPSPCTIAVDVAEGDVPIDTTASTTHYDLTGICDPGPYGNDMLHNIIAFRFTASATGFCTLSTCNQADFDTRIAVISDCALNVVSGCLDDTDGCNNWTTALEIFVTAGAEYVVVVGGYADTDRGTGTLTITSSGPCEAPESNGDEDEPCGKDTNGGCNNADGLTRAIEDGDVLTGSVWAEGGARDTDWFEFTVTEYSRVHFDLYRAAPLWGILEAVEGACAGYAGGGACPHAFEQCLLPGTYRIAITTPGFEGYPCGDISGDYTIACTITPNGCEPDLTFSDPVEYATADGGDGRFYTVARLNSGAMNWATMRYLVEGRGGEFGMLKDQAILDALWPTLLSDPANWAGCNGPMLGLTQDASADDFSEPAGGWYWADGTPLDQEWAPWLPGEPNEVNSASRGQFYSACAIAPDFDDVPNSFGGTRFLLSFPNFEDCNENSAPDSWDIGAGVLADDNGDGVPDECSIYNPWVLSSAATWSENGHTYIVFMNDNTLSWPDSVAEAERFGGHLGTITSEAESTFVFDSLVNDEAWWTNSYWNNGPFLGGIVVDGILEWITAEPVEYENWYPGEPSGDNGTFYLQYFTIDAGPGPTWDDIFDYEPKNRMLVEFEDFADCNENGSPDAFDIAYDISEDTNRDGVPDECGVSCTGDFNGDAIVDGADLTTLLGTWGQDGAADINDDGLIDGADLTILLGAWGPC